MRAFRIAVLLLIAGACWCAPINNAYSQSSSKELAVEGDHFVFDGKPIQIISGELHYARIPRAYWRNRLQMARAMGLNTIATYVFWNVHEPVPGVFDFDFSGNNDLAAFIKIAQEEHLHVLLRAGPYSCAEWEFGGFPAWLLKDPKMETALRTKDPAFMVPVERWIKRLAQEVGPLQSGNGGPIIATQIENEYGNFSNDHAYMQQMHDVFVQAGFTKSLLYTVDPSKALANGMIDGIYAGVNFGTGRAEPALDALAKLRPGQPLFATEYWPGWFDLWGHPHETRPVAPQLQDLDYMLSHKASVNIYMVHGGTSFGQMAGASESTGAYRGNVTSYDYDAPIDEAGHPTPKFFAYRDVILKYTHEKPLPLPNVATVISIPEFTLHATTSLWDVLPKPVASEQPLTMEQLDQAYGYVLYRKMLPSAVHGELKLDHLYDFGLVYLNGKLIRTLDRHYHQDTIHLDTDKPVRLDILVENTGRLNSTKWMRNERKGFRAALLDNKPLLGWGMYSLPIASEPKTLHSKDVSGPHFAAGEFDLTEVGDTFLDVRSLGKGLIWINGHALGRFWNIGPQDTLYLPGAWLKKGHNHLAILELLDAKPAPTLRGLTKPILDGATPGYENDPERRKKIADDAEFGAKLAAPAATIPTTPDEPWDNSANWHTVKPIETDNIVYATVPHIMNPSAEASPDPGKPNGIRSSIPNTGSPGTLDMHLDVYQVPSTKPTPVVIQIHGGGWIRGDRPSSSTSFGPFFSAGMSVVAVQYRNAIDAPAPAAIADVRCAMAWVKANAKQYNFDPDKVITWGGSAGGYLALMAAYAPDSFNPEGCKDQPKVAAVIDMYGASDVAESLTYPGSMAFTHQWIGLDLPLAGTEHEPNSTTALASSEATNPDGMPRQRKKSQDWPVPSEAVLARAHAVSPLTYIREGLPPTFIINGDQDQTYNPTQSYKLKAALDAAHVPNEEDIVIGGGHGNFSPAESQKGIMLWMRFLHNNKVF